MMNDLQILSQSSASLLKRVSKKKQNAQAKELAIQQHTVNKNRLRERRQQLIDQYN
jgi:hypothetical protein